MARRRAIFRANLPRGREWERRGKSYEEERGGARRRAEEKTWGKKAQAAITKRQETIIIAP